MFNLQVALVLDVATHLYAGVTLRFFQDTLVIRTIKRGRIALTVKVVNAFAGVATLIDRLEYDPDRGGHNGA